MNAVLVRLNPPLPVINKEPLHPERSGTAASGFNVQLWRNDGWERTFWKSTTALKKRGVGGQRENECGLNRLYFRSNGCAENPHVKESKDTQHQREQRAIPMQGTITSRMINALWGGAVKISGLKRLDCISLSQRDHRTCSRRDD